MNRRDPSTLIVAVSALLYAAAAFLVHLRWYPIGDLGVESDFYAELVVSAQRLAAGEFSVANYPFKGPVYSFALVAVHAVASLFGADWYRSAVLLNALAAGATLLVAFRLQRRIFGTALAVVTTLALALAFEFFLHAHKASSDLLYLLLHTAAMAAVIGARGRGRLMGAGALAALAFLTRYSGAVLVPAGLLTILILGRDAGARLSRSGLFLLGFLIVSGPWFAMNQAQTGRLLPANNVTNLEQAFYTGEKKAEIPAGGFDSAVELIAHDPDHFLGGVLRNVPDHLAKDMNQLLGRRVGPALALGALVLTVLAFVSRRHRPDRAQTAFLLGALLTFLGLCLVFHRPRFSLPLVTAYAALGYGGLLGLRSETRRPLVFVAFGLAAAVSYFQVGTILRGEHFYRERAPVQVLTQGPVLREIAGRHGARTLLARKPHLAHYAGLEHLAYPGEPGEWLSFLQGCHDRGVDLILVGPWEREAFAGTLFLPLLDHAVGVERVGDVEDLTVFRLDRDVPRERVGGVRGEEDALRRVLAARDSGDATSFIRAQADVARLMVPLARWERAATSLTHALDAATRHPGAVSAPERDGLTLSLAFCRLGQERWDEGLALLGGDLANLRPTEDGEQSAFRHTVFARLAAGAGRKADAHRHFRAALELHLAAGRGSAARQMAAAIEALH